MSNRFLELREKMSKVMNKPISQRQLAKLLGIAQARISELEGGKRYPSFMELKAYHNYFRVSYEYLYGETDSYVSTDVFSSKPRIETKMENTLRWLNETEYPDEIELAETTHFLLETDLGLLLLYYINQHFKGVITPETLAEIISECKKEEYQEYSYTALRIMFDEKIK